MNKLSLVPATSGTGNLLSEPVVAAPSILTGLECSNETLISLSACVAGLLNNTLNGDVIVLALLQARDIAVASGVSKEEFERVHDIIVHAWKRSRSSNPLSGMF